MVYWARQPCASTPNWAQSKMESEDKERKSGIRVNCMQANTEALELRGCQKRPRLGDTFQSERAQKVLYTGPSRPTYIPPQDLLGKDQLVDNILTESCTGILQLSSLRLDAQFNKVHFVLSEQQRRSLFRVSLSHLPSWARIQSSYPKQGLLQRQSVWEDSGRKKFSNINS